MTADCFAFSDLPGVRRRLARRSRPCLSLAPASAAQPPVIVHSLADSALNAARHLELSMAQARIAELEREILALRDLAQRDPLTGVLNRRGFAEAFARELARQIRQGVPLTLAVIDLDDFKQLNDSCGHAAGDEALVRLTRTLLGALRPMDCLGRLGGEEFAILLPASEVGAAVQTLERLQAACAGIVLPHGACLSFSAGVALVQCAESLDALLSRADAAVYRAKAAGKRRVEVA